MNRWHILVVLCALLVACDARKNTAVVGAVYNNELANALQQSEIFNKTRTPLEFESGTSDEAKSENYRQYQTLVVYDVGNAGPLRAVLYTIKMNAQRPPH